ncbi:MAG: patatin-like phospholipase family protein, partial [Akkermansiaceae bacterium]|nr:patatin-like phospholipase family protein [Akkermansiaceae bacterium]
EGMGRHSSVNPSSKPTDHPRLLPKAVRKKEGEYLEKRQGKVACAAAGKGENLGLKPDEPVGIALSGGGIRSATFSLGILQVLARHRMFRLVDFLSTVSGGGYIGSCLTSLLTAQETEAEAPGNYDTEEDFPFKDPDQIHHLRKHGNYLIAREGVFRRDSLRAIGTVLSAIAASLAVFISLLVLLAGGFVCFTSIMGSEEIWKEMRKDFSEFAVDFPEYREGSPQEVKAMIEVEKRLGTEDVGRVGTKVAEDWTEKRVFEPKLKSGFDWSIAFDQFRPRWRWVRRFALGGFGAALLVSAPFFMFGVRRIAKIRKVNEDGGFPGELKSDRAERRQLIAFSIVMTLVLTGLLVIVAIAAKDESPNCSWIGELHREIYQPVLEVESSPRGMVPMLAGARIFLLATAFFGGAEIATWIWWLGIARKHSRRRSPSKSNGDEKPKDPGKLEEKQTKDRTERSYVAAAHGLSLILTLISISVVGILLLTWWFNDHYIKTGMTGLVALLATRLFATTSQGNKTGAGGIAAKLKSLALALLLRLSAFLLVVSGIVFALGTMLRVMNDTPVGTGFLVAAVAALVLIVLFWFIDFNHVSMHHFYRDRLLETYLQTEAERGRSLMLVRDQGNLKVCDLHRSDKHESPGQTPESDAPYHLLVTALNLPGSRDLARRDRKSDHFVFSRFYCGSSTTGYVETATYDGGETLLARVMTISGAAASSLMGFHTFFSQAFAMTLFNIRLGYWMPNPLSYPCAKFPDGQPTREQQEKAGIPFPVKPGHRPFWLRYLFRELYALANAREPFVNLSDGAHTGDNIGLYPLFQRRCRLIVACDGECDGRYDFGSLASAIRQIYTDENVEVDIDLSGFEPDEKTGEVKRHFAVGRIQYPDDAEAYKRGKVGWLLYLKSSFTGDEGAAVRSYKRTCPEFPHQTTGDQFFSDDQFEAYRSLGEHIAREISCRIKKESNPNHDKNPVKGREGSDAGECLYVDVEGDFELQRVPLSVEDIVEWCKGEYANAMSRLRSSSIGKAETGTDRTAN